MFPGAQTLSQDKIKSPLTCRGWLSDALRSPLLLTRSFQCVAGNLSSAACLLCAVLRRADGPALRLPSASLRGCQRWSDTGRCCLGYFSVDSFSGLSVSCGFCQLSSWRRAPCALRVLSAPVTCYREEEEEERRSAVWRGGPQTWTGPQHPLVSDRGAKSVYEL